ncbi:MAG TPA: hypothetical protein VGB68_11910 [Pyrinomonadaceae bacterium]|jgi:hypothetical protein
MPYLLKPDSRILFLLRAVLLTGVLAGLLFSCGEGIRLFPFPPAATQYAQSGWKNGEKVGYQKNALRFEQRQGNYQSKIQRDNQPHYWTDVYNTLHKAPAFAASPARENAVLFNSPFFKSHLFSISGASRAPPVSS